MKDFQIEDKIIGNERFLSCPVAMMITVVEREFHPVPTPPALCSSPFTSVGFRPHASSVSLRRERESHERKVRRRDGKRQRRDQELDGTGRE